MYAQPGLTESGGHDAQDLWSDGDFQPCLLAINSTQKDWLGEFFGAPKSVLPVMENSYLVLRWNVGNTLLVLALLGLAYLWFTSKDPG